MRKIKFRAWQQYSLQMFEVTGLVWSAALSHKFSRLELLSMDGNYTVRNVTGEACDNYILMQFTGLHDKQGKEVYESDILLLSENIYSVAMEPRFLFTHTQRYKVYWRDDRWGLVDSKGNDYDNGDCYRGDDINNWNEFEVIGNVYEQPELLSPPELLSKEQ